MSSAVLSEPTVNPGELNKRVWLQNPVTNAAGEATWQNSLGNKVWANIQPLTGREIFQAQQVYPEADTLITIRYRLNVTTAMRVLYGTRTYDIKDVNDVEERHRRIDLTCVERPAERNT